MIRHRRTLAAAMAVAGFSMFAGAPIAVAQTPDEQFAALVTALGINTAPNSDLPAAGHHVCDMLTSGLSGAVNPVPVVRGVLTNLETQGLTREQAGGLLKGSVAIYCPQNGRFIGR